ncbi:hypothetical protein [Staphylococcus pettenkoferi]|nr:hypothetical protein [Staphylococcus pettenkoferi]MCY1628141.1 hypothetical protein [Staphylococcus pettenkoferi]
MKFGFRTPSVKKSLKARTTGAAKRKVKSASTLHTERKVWAMQSHRRKP